MEVSLLSEKTHCTLETIRVLHQTVLALKTALEGSQKQLLELQNKSQFQSSSQSKNILSNETKSFELAQKLFFLELMDDKKEREKERKSSQDSEDSDAKIVEKYKLDSETESDDIDDIELVFTTCETELSSIHEDLVPIEKEGGKVKFSTQNVIVGTDISKCGVIDESETVFMGKRNTFSNASPYQPMEHRELFLTTKPLPVKASCKAELPGTQEMGAQTDITALPAHWKSETHLSHKMNRHLMTLPSKFSLPVSQTKRLPLSDKTCEARRVLLSDLNFTSMVPELSRSADHLHEEKQAAKSQQNAFDSLKSPKTEKCCELMRQESRSSCGSYYGSKCQTSSASIPSFVCEDMRRRHSWKPPHVYCCRSKHFYWSSVPSSPIKCTHEINEESFQKFSYLYPSNKRRRAKVRFFNCDPCGRSMPNLPMEGDSGDSTDSLLEETEEFLRRSIDKIIISTRQMRKERRFSDADFVSGLEPPKMAQPFLPKTVKDLKPNCFAKVISPDGKVVCGKIRYAGSVSESLEPYVGVELDRGIGFSDGTFMGHHFFDCAPAHAIFVPFKKVVIAWRV